MDCAEAARVTSPYTTYRTYATHWTYGPLPRRRLRKDIRSNRQHENQAHKCIALEERLVDPGKIKR